MTDDPHTGGDSKAAEDIFPPKDGTEKDISHDYPDSALKTAKEVKLHARLSTGTVNVSRHWKEGGVLVKEEDDEGTIEVQLFAHDHLAKVGTSASMTLNMENYESVRVEVHAELPCYIEEMAAAFVGVKDFVDKRLSEEVKNLQAYREERKKKGR